MKREIKFRGLRADGKGWIYGDYAYYAHENKHFIAEFEGIESGQSLYVLRKVIPETVGQFTGLKDKNGVEIWEGDIVKYETTLKYDKDGNRIKYIGEIQFWNGQMGCGWRYKSHRYTMMIKHSHSWRMEVIGNIHDKTESEVVK